MNDVCVPAELVEALAQEWEAADFTGEYGAAMSWCAGRLRALVDAVERPRQTVKELRDAHHRGIDTAVVPPSEDSHVWSESGRSTFCRIQGVQTYIEDGECSGCGATVPPGPMVQIGVDDAGNPIWDTAPAAPPSEPPCRCGHAERAHGKTGCGYLIEGSGCEIHVCPCLAFIAPPRPSISDEAEAELERFPFIALGTAAEREAFITGFRAARQEEA